MEGTETLLTWLIPVITVLGCIAGFIQVKRIYSPEGARD